MFDTFRHPTPVAPTSLSQHPASTHRRLCVRLWVVNLIATLEHIIPRREMLTQTRGLLLFACLALGLSTVYCKSDLRPVVPRFASSPTRLSTTGWRVQVTVVKGHFKPQFMNGVFHAPETIVDISLNNEKWHTRSVRTGYNLKWNETHTFTTALKASVRYGFSIMLS